MGLISEVKSGTAGDHAARARKEGRTVFVYRYKLPTIHTTASSEPVGGAAEVIEGIERQGWGLQHMAFDDRQGRKGSILLLFRPARH